MGRPSKLTDKQWEQIGRRLVAGEKASALAKEFKVSRATISERFSESVGKVKTVANQLLAAEDSLKSLTLSEQASAITLADRLRNISTHVAGAAELAAASAHRLHGIAHDQVQKIDDAEPEKSLAALQRFGAQTKLGNDALFGPLSLLNANKDSVKLVNQDTPVTPVRIVVQVEDASLPEAQ